MCACLCVRAGGGALARGWNAEQHHHVTCLNGSFPSALSSAPVHRAGRSHSGPLARSFSRAPREKEGWGGGGLRALTCANINLHLIYSLAHKPTSSRAGAPSKLDDPTRKCFFWPSVLSTRARVCACAPQVQEGGGEQKLAHIHYTNRRDCAVARIQFLASRENGARMSRVFVFSSR